MRAAQVVADVFTPPGPRRRLRRMGRVASARLELAGGRLFSCGTHDAVATVSASRSRQLLVALVGAVALFAVMVGPAAIGLVVSSRALIQGGLVLVGVAGAIVCIILVVAVWWCWGRRTEGSRARTAVTPKGAWHLHSLARRPDRPAGAGRTVLDQVADQADQAGAAVYLDCEHLGLVSYYQAAGWELKWTSPGPDRRGRRHYRLVRRPRSAGGGAVGGEAVDAPGGGPVRPVRARSRPAGYLGVWHRPRGVSSGAKDVTPGRTRARAG